MNALQSIFLACVVWPGLPVPNESRPVRPSPPSPPRSVPAIIVRCVPQCCGSTAVPSLPSLPPFCFCSSRIPRSPCRCCARLGSPPALSRLPPPPPLPAAPRSSRRWPRRRIRRRWSSLHPPRLTSQRVGDGLRRICVPFLRTAVRRGGGCLVVPVGGGWWKAEGRRAVAYPLREPSL